VASISTKSSESISSPSRLRNTSMKQVFALSLGIPAVAVSILLLRPLGTKNTQTAGFLLIAFSFTLIAAVYETLLKEHPNILYGIYCLVLFSVSGGPAVTSFVLPAETFPKEIRATFGGIAAACGKLGAFVGAYLFGPLASVTSYPVVMAVCAVLSLLGALLTHICVGAEGRAEDQNCAAHNTPSISSGGSGSGLGTGASDCTVSLMHSQALNGSDTSPRLSPTLHDRPSHQPNNHITADSGIDEEAATGSSGVTVHL
jgi:MFS family permease